MESLSVIRMKIRNKLNRMRHLKVKLSIFFIGFSALLWFIVRVIPKPSRATYPCQRAAFPIASAFVIWIAGTLFSHSIFKKAKMALGKGNKSIAFVFSLLAVLIFIVSIFILEIGDSAFSAINFNTVSKEGKMLYAKTEAGITESIITPEATVAIVRSEKTKATDITFDDINSMIRQAVEMAGGFDTLIHEGDVVVIKPNVIAGRAQNSPFSNPFPAEANGIATDYRIIQVVVNMVREKNSTGKIVLLEGSGYGLTRKNMDAIGYNNITGLDSIIYLDENIVKWYDTASSDLVKVSLPAGKNLYSTTNKYYLNKLYYEADVLISLPCVKSHFLTGITGSIKNVGIGATPVEMYGNGTGVAEDDLPGRWNHINHGDFSTQTVPLDKWIHDFYLCRPVDYVIMDGLQGADYGPYPGSNSSHTLASVQKNMRVILAGSDPLAIDAIEALITGFDPYLIGHLVFLGKDSIGCINPAFIKVKGIQVNEIKTDFGEDNPGKKCKSTDFTPPQNDTLKSCSIDNNGINISLITNDDVVKVEVAYDGVILNEIAVKDFSNLVFPFPNSNGNANKISVLLYDKYLNCTKLSLEHPTNEIHQAQLLQMQLYPNPASNIIKFNLPYKTSNEWVISVYSLDGKLALSKRLDNNEKQQLDISNFQSGSYLVKLTSKELVYQTKLVKTDNE
jgi:uncharacterized protein (DUF362 family)